MTIRTQIRDRLIALLNEDRPSDMPEAERGKWVAGEESKTPRICVSLSEEPQDRKNRTFPVITRDLQVLITCGCAVAEPSEGEDAVEPMLQWVDDTVNRIEPQADFQGLVHDVRAAATKWESAQMDAYYVAATIAVLISYQTKRGDMDAKQ